SGANQYVIFLTAVTHSTNFDNDATLSGGPNGAANADNNAIAELDNFCASSLPARVTRNFKGLVGVLTQRDPPTNWPIAANRSYYRYVDGMRIFTTDASAQFDFTAGTLDNNFTTASNYWTGIDASTYPWTIVGNATPGAACSGFTTCGSGGGLSAWY